MGCEEWREGVRRHGGRRTGHFTGGSLRLGHHSASACKAILWIWVETGGAPVSRTTPRQRVQMNWQWETQVRSGQPDKPLSRVESRAQ